MSTKRWQRVISHKSEKELISSPALSGSTPEAVLPARFSAAQMLPGAFPSSRVGSGESLLLLELMSSVRKRACPQHPRVMLHLPQTCWLLGPLLLAKPEASLRCSCGRCCFPWFHVLTMENGRSPCSFPVTAAFVPFYNLMARKANH